MGLFLLLTGVLVLVPLAAELRAGDRIGRELASAGLIALGLILAGASLWLLAGPARDRSIEAGVALTLIGLLLRPAEVYPTGVESAEETVVGGEQAPAT